MTRIRDDLDGRISGKHPVKRAFGGFASRAAHVTGSAWAFGLAAVLILLWGVSGPFFGFSDTWQLAINTTTTIVTFLMVFLIQHAQNKDTRALQLKLNELVAAVEGASNRLIDIEDLTDEELEVLHERYENLSEDADHIRAGASTSVETEMRTKTEAKGRKGAKGGGKGKASGA